VKSRFIHIILFCTSLLFTEERSYTTTTFDYLWNTTLKRLKFRDPVSFTPFELRVGVLSYGGSDYWDSSLLDTNLGKDLPVILDSTTTTFDILQSESNRKAIFFEVDFLRFNITNYIYPQNITDIQIGLGYRRINANSDPELPSVGSWYSLIPDGNTRGSFRFRPKINDFNFNASITFQFTHYLMGYSYHSLGYSYGTLYESTGGDFYLSGNGLSEALAVGIKVAYHPKSQNFSFVYGLEGRWNRTVFKSVDDPSHISHIKGMDMHAKGIYLTFGTIFGGRRTNGDKGFSHILRDEFMDGARNLEAFIDDYPRHSRLNEVHDLLEFCYEQIPYQQFHQGLEALEDADVETAAAWLNKAADTANPSLMFEIESHKKDLAMVLVDSVALNKSEMTFTQAELIINKALLISPNYPMGIEALANLYIEKGNVLYEQKNFARATSYYQRALKVDPDSRAEVQNKYNDLAESLMDEANTFSANDDYIMAIEALKSLIDIDPSRELDLSPQIEKMKSLLAVEEEKKTQDKISEMVAVRRKKMIPKESIMVLLGMTPYQVENVLGKPDHQDTMENAGITYEMWTYTKNAKAKRLYFENKLLVKIDR